MGDSHFYVYALLDSRNPGVFIYGDIIFNFEPFYIGKGKYKRWKMHTQPSSLKSRNLKNNKIKSILESNHKVIPFKIKNNLNEKDAFLLEKKLIGMIGRLEEKTGILTNHSNGGEGQSGFKHSIETRIKMSFSSRKNKNAKCKSDLFKKSDEEKQNNLKMKIENQQQYYKIINPDKSQVIVRGLKNYCKNNNLHYQAMISVSKGRLNSYKGYICKKLIFIIKNLKDYCIKNNLNYTSLLKLSRNNYKSRHGKLLNNYKNWKIEFLTK